MMDLRLLALVTLAWTTAASAEQVLTPRLHHLRATDAQEWADFPRLAEGAGLLLRFDAQVNEREASLRLRQQDVRQTWKVLLNGKELGRLKADENDMVVYLPVPAGALSAGTNTLAIEQVGRSADDIRVGEIVLDPRPMQEVLGEATIEVQVLEGAQPVPCRLTLQNAQGALATVLASGPHLAVRAGVVYTATGRARFTAPPGAYTLYAGRGFEYGIDSVPISARAGEVARHRLQLRREVPTAGHVCCDTHVHTLTYSGHGDASADERVVTLAGEGIELPIATEHNLQVDYHAAAVKLGVRRYFTPVVGNEVTTPVGHFNIFPVTAGGPVPDFKLQDWRSAAASIAKAAPGAVILNHARDRHSNFVPFGPQRHLALTGEDLDGWELPASAMEIVNSGAQQTDVLRLVHDWLGLLNRGLTITPVGASDSHDVCRYIVGQARTYIRCPDDHPGAIDVAAAVDSFRQGRVLVGCGLLTEIRVNGQYGPGDLVPAAQEINVGLRVLGPSWVRADRIALYVNGVQFREEKIESAATPGVKWQGVWTLPKLRHDVHLVAVATGPGVRELYWPIARPYQPTSPLVEPRVIGVTGAVWIDADGDGKRTSAWEYARRIVAAHEGRAIDVIKALADHDEAVAVQAASLLQRRGASLHDAALRAAAERSGAHVARGVDTFVAAWRDSQTSRR